MSVEIMLQGLYVAVLVSLSYQQRLDCKIECNVTTNYIDMACACELCANLGCTNTNGDDPINFKSNLCKKIQQAQQCLALFNEMPKVMPKVIDTLKNVTVVKDTSSNNTANGVPYFIWIIGAAGCFILIMLGILLLIVLLHQHRKRTQKHKKNEAEAGLELLEHKPQTMSDQSAIHGIVDSSMTDFSNTSYRTNEPAVISHQDESTELLSSQSELNSRPTAMISTFEPVLVHRTDTGSDDSTNIESQLDSQSAVTVVNVQQEPTDAALVEASNKNVSRPVALHIGSNGPQIKELIHPNFAEQTYIPSECLGDPETPVSPPNVPIVTVSVISPAEVV